jgi:hypothetical protein
MLTKEGIASLRERLTAVREAGAQYFGHAAPVKVNEGYAGHSWAVANAAHQAEAEDLRTTIKSLSVDIAGAARGSPLIAEADLQDLRHNTRQMLANVRFNRYRHWGVNVHHDEDIVLGVDPPSQDESALTEPDAARAMFDAAAVAVRDLVDLLSPAETVQTGATGTASYKPNTAFIMMAIDNTKPELEDVKNAIKDVFKEFGVQAVTADDIEHDDAITDRILDQIESSEFLFADMTGERPNVYYEIGHAHARNKRVMLYRKVGAKLHFDLAHRNCPEYANVTALKEMLRKRLEVVTNKPKKP